MNVLLRNVFSDSPDLHLEFVEGQRRTTAFPKKMKQDRRVLLARLILQLLNESTLAMIVKGCYFSSGLFIAFADFGPIRKQLFGGH